MTPYPEYKPTGLPWLPLIPKHWKPLPLRCVFEERKEKNAERQNNNILSVTCHRGVIPYSEKGNLGNKCSEDITRYSVVHKGDIVLNCMNVIIGSVGKSLYNGVLSPVYYVLKNRDTTIHNTDFFAYIFRMQTFYKGLKIFGKGILDHRLRIAMIDLKTVMFPTPPFVEQVQIVRYLDAMTAKINKLIRAKKKQIVLLQEQKQSIINRAVTKGLDPNAEMKDSGIDWLGKIHAHWEVKRLGNFSSLQNGISAPAEYFGEGFPFMGYGDVYNNFEIPQQLSGLAKSTVEDQKRYSVQFGDIFFTRTSETMEEIAFSAVCLKTIPYATFSGFLIRARPHKNTIVPLFSKFYFRNMLLRNYFVKEMNLVTRASLSQQLLRNLPVLVPPTYEQKEIAQFLETKNKKIDVVTRALEEEIALYLEYKNSLISSVVTGQVDIRNIAVEDVAPADLVPEDDAPAADDPEEEQLTAESEA